MADNVAITAGSGTNVATDDVGGVHFQKVKLDGGGDGVSAPIGGDATYGLDVDVTRVSGNVTVVQATAANLKVDASGVAVPITDNSGSLTVDAPVGTPVFVRLSDGTSAIAALPVTDNGGTLSVDDGGGTLTVDGTVAISGTVPVSDGSGSLTVDDGGGSLTVDGTVTAACNDGGGSLTVDDGGLTLSVDDGGGSLTVDGTVGISGTVPVSDAGGSLTVDGTVSISGTVPVSDAGSSLTVDGTVTVNQGSSGGGLWNCNLSYISGGAIVPAAVGVMKTAAVDEAGAAFAETNPLPVRLAYPEHTRFRYAVTYSASQADIPLFTPTGGKRYVLEGYIVSPTATGVVKIFDNTNAAANMHFQGTPNGTAPGSHIVVTPTNPMASAAVNNVLRYSTGAGAAGDITVWGYEV